MTPFKIPEPPHTIEGVMEELRRIFEPAPEAPAPPAAAVATGDPAADLRALAEALERARDVTPHYWIESHRRLLKIFIDPVKKLAHWATRPYVNLLIEKQNRFNEEVVRAVREAARAVEAQGRARGEQLAQNAVFQEAHERAAAFAANQTSINAAFQKTRERVEPFIGHQEHRNASFQAACERADNFAKHQDRWNREVSAIDERQDRLIEALREIAARLEARHDLGPFFEAIPPERRTKMLDRFRGTYGHLKGLHHVYIPHFRNRPGHVLDVGCGRGEFLDMLRGEGIGSWGCEIDDQLIEWIRERGMVAEKMDALTALRSVQPGSLGGVFASQVIEHLFPGDLLTFIMLARKALAPGGAIALETVNPQSLGVLAKSYYKDLDHKQAIDPDYLADLLRLAGFVNVEVHRLRPFGEDERLADVPPAEALGLSEPARDALAAVVEKLNSAIWGSQDYYVSGETPRGEAQAR